METELEIERLPVDLLAHIFSFILSFKDLAQASGVCRRWRRGVKESLSRKERLSFAGWKVDDESAARVVRAAYNIKELDMLKRRGWICILFSFFYHPPTPSHCHGAVKAHLLPRFNGFPSVIVLFMRRSRSRSCWGCQITDEGLYKISLTKCVSNLLSISMWGMAGITDRGVIQLVTKANSLQHLNVGGTFITDESLYAIANSCPQIKTIVLWSCRHVTENGLNKLVDKCCKLESINVWGMKVPVDCFLRLLAISPTLELKPLTQHLGVGRIWPAS